MDYAYPEYLKYYWLVAAYAALGFALLWRQWRAHHRAVERSLAQRFGPAFSGPRFSAKLVLLLAAACLLIRALACELGAPQQVEQETRGADILIAVDVSSSMHAQDIKPDRLAAVKQTLDGFMNRLDGDRVGLVAFAGKAVVACPLTTDYETAALFLDKLDTDSVPEDGTGLGPALQTCLDKFAADPKRGRMILLVTDGEENEESDTMEQARRAASAGVPVFTLGIGTPGGSYIPDGADIFGRVRVKTFQGQPVVTRLDEGILRRIAGATGGEYANGFSRLALEGALDRLRQLKQGLAKGQTRFTREPLYQDALFLALILLLAEALLSGRGGGLVRSARMAWGKAREIFELALKRRGWKAAAFWLALWMAASGFSLDPGRAEYDQGNAMYRQQKFQEAGAAYQASLGQDPQRAVAHYNLGNAMFQQGDYPAAASEYEKALQIDPSDRDAAFNLDLARRKMQGQGKKEEDGKDKKDGQGQKGGDQQNQDKGGEKQGSSGQGREGGNKKGQKQDAGQAKAATKVNPEEAQALLNMLKSDQQKYNAGFQPLKKYRKNQPDPMQQMFEQMTGRKLPQAREQGGDNNKKNW